MQKKEQYIIDLDRLSEGRHTFSFELDSDFLSGMEKTELLGIDAKANADLTLRADGLDLNMDICGKVTVCCDRCLDPMELDVNVSEKHIETEEGTKQLDLAWTAYEMIIVNLPVVHSHPLGGCNPQMAALLQNHLCSTAEDPEAI